MISDADPALGSGAEGTTFLPARVPCREQLQHQHTPELESKLCNSFLLIKGASYKGENRTVL